MHNSDPAHPFAGETVKPHDIDLGDGHCGDHGFIREGKWVRA